MVQLYKGTTRDQRVIFSIPSKGLPNEREGPFCKSPQLKLGLLDMQIRKQKHYRTEPFQKPFWDLQ